MGQIRRLSYLVVKDSVVSSFLISSLSSLVRVYSRTSFLRREGFQAFLGRPPRDRVAGLEAAIEKRKSTRRKKQIVLASSKSTFRTLERAVI